MKTAELNVFVVIPFYNGDECIESCVHSVLQSDEIRCKVVLVDNSTLPTRVSELFQDKGEEVVVIKTAPAIGFAKANNIGADYAIKNGATHVLCLNQDTTVEKDMLRNLLSAVLQNNQLGIVAPLIYDYTSKEIEPFYVHYYYGQIAKLFSDAVNNSLRPYYTTDKISGACFLMSRDLINRYGLFDENYFMYSEDEDLCRKIHYLGFQIAVVPSARINHLHGNTRKDLTRFESEQKQMWQRMSSHIYTFKNTHTPFYKSFFSVSKKNIVSYFDLLLSFRFRLLLKYLWVDLKTIIMLPHVHKSYQKEKRLSK
ncbi:MAG TPA: glycosyltransferase family 2 protein [Ferruginibacter sp.]|nr:glycosyltransferase family 2 protein [Ferruginibacter sp.]HRO05302.1 glycosyltransferase family 2 protein [Ferruginibacter sp.]HRO96066.1 glycosyltransferase family 2 protein [Ferruginibacter sp.]HRP48600.1 glycosyltransferase family 2 protein [Ferruginibacter sp.]